MIEGARYTEDGYPIIERWMVTTDVPKSLSQWNCRSKVKDKANTAMSFYCNDTYFQPVINNPDKYIRELEQYSAVLGMDASPYDNFSPIVQCSQIFVNLAITYYFGRIGLKVIPNVRIGHVLTYKSLKAYPHNTLIAIGTNGFVKETKNKLIFRDQLKLICETIKPTALIVYGTTPIDIFEPVYKLNIPVFSFESYIHARRRKSNEGKL